MKTKAKSPEINLKLLVTESNFLRPGTISANQLRGSKVICKFHNSFGEKLRKYNDQWECDRYGLLKTVSNSLVSTSTQVRKVFIDKIKIKKLVVKPSLPQYTKSTKNITLPKAFYESKKLKELETKETESGSDLIRKHHSLGVLHNESRGELNKSPKPLALRKDKVEVTLPLMQVSSFNDLDCAVAGPGFRPGKNMSTTLYPNRYKFKKQKEVKVEENQPGFDLTQLPPGIEVPYKSQTIQKFKYKSFAEAKNLPLHRISVENNLLLKLRKFRGRLK